MVLYFSLEIRCAGSSGLSSAFVLILALKKRHAQRAVVRPVAPDLPGGRRCGKSYNTFYKRTLQIPR